MLELPAAMSELSVAEAPLRKTDARHTARRPARAQPIAPAPRPPSGPTARARVARAARRIAGDGDRQEAAAVERRRRPRPRRALGRLVHAAPLAALTPPPRPPIGPVSAQP